MKFKENKKNIIKVFYVLPALCAVVFAALFIRSFFMRDTEKIDSGNISSDERGSLSVTDNLNDIGGTIMKAGFGREDITPSLGVELCGYGYDLKRRAQSIHDNLYASCLAFEIDGERYLIINCDLIGFDGEIISEIKNKINSKYGIGEESVMVIATHTHTGPAVKYYVGCGERDETYIKGLPEKILASVDYALGDLNGIEYIQTSENEIAPIGFNRVIRDGPEDHFVRGFLIKRTSAPDIAVASYNCHPVSMGTSTAVSADYPGQAAEALREMGMHGMFITGICGDIDPAGIRGQADIIREYGKRIAQGFIDGLSGEKQYPESFYHTIINVDIPLQAFDGEKVRETAARAIKSADNAGYRRVVKIWENTISDALKEGSLKYEAGRTQIFSIGGMVIAGINYEAFTEIGMKIREAIPDKTIIIAGNTDAVRGYFATAEAIDTGGGYEAMDSVFLYQKLPVTRDGADILAGSVISGIGGIWER